MRILLTGANGHIGCALAPMLIDHGHELRLLLHQRDDGVRHLPAERITGDIRDTDTVDRAMRGMDAVIHLAARISIDSAHDPLVWPVNVDGTRHVVDACVRHRIQRLVHFSSIHSYDPLPLDAPLDETRAPATPQQPVYDRSKAAADRLVQEAMDRHGLCAVIIAPTSVFGPHDHGPSLLGRAIIDIHAGRVPMLTPGGYDFVDVRDVARTAVVALDRGTPEGKYLVSGQYRTVVELAAAIGALSGHRTVQRVAPAPLLKALLPFFRLQARVTGRPALFTREALEALLHGHRDIRSTRAERVLGHSRTPFHTTLADALAGYTATGWLKD